MYMCIHAYIHIYIYIHTLSLICIKKMGPAGALAGRAPPEGRAGRPAAPATYTYVYVYNTYIYIYIYVK